MNVYVETNFVLKLELWQEQFKSCEAILSLCKEGRIRLAGPAFSSAEPHEGFTRRQKPPKKTKEDLEAELVQIARSALYMDRLRDFGDLTALLISASDVAAKHLDARISLRPQTERSAMHRLGPVDQL